MLLAHLLYFAVGITFAISTISIGAIFNNGIDNTLEEIEKLKSWYPNRAEDIFGITLIIGVLIVFWPFLLGAGIVYFIGRFIAIRALNIFEQFLIKIRDSAK